MARWTSVSSHSSWIDLLCHCSVDQAGAYVDFGGKMPLFCPTSECSVVKLQSVSTPAPSDECLSIPVSVQKHPQRLLAL